MTVSANAQFSLHTQLINFYVNASHENSSQTTYGDAATNPNLNYLTTKVQATYISINPSYGFFVKENLMLSIGPIYEYISREILTDYNYLNQPMSESTQNYINNNYGGKISLTKYITLSNKLYWYYSFQMSYVYGTGKTEILDSPNNQRIYNLNIETIHITGGIGLSFLLSEYILINGGIGSMGWRGSWSKTYKSNSSDLASENSGSKFDIGGITITLGLSFVIHRH